MAKRFSTRDGLTYDSYGNRYGMPDETNLDLGRYAQPKALQDNLKQPQNNSAFTLDNANVKRLLSASDALTKGLAQSRHDQNTNLVLLDRALDIPRSVCQVVRRDYDSGKFNPLLKTKMKQIKVACKAMDDFDDSHRNYYFGRLRDRKNVVNQNNPSFVDRVSWPVPD